MDVSKLDYNFIESFAGDYTTICDVYGNTDEKNPKELKKIRKWVEKTFLDGIDYPEKVTKYISEDVSNSDFFEFFKACKIHIEKEGTKQKQLFEKNAEGLSAEAKFALWKLLEFYNCYCYNGIKTRGDDAYIIYTDSSACQGTLIFKNAEGIPTQSEYITFHNAVNSFIKDDEGYRLVGLTGDWDEETETPFVIRFTDVQVETEIFNANPSISDNNNPWSYMIEANHSILCKETDIYNYNFNEKEKELLPLLKEIKTFHWMYCQDDNAIAKFPIFKALLKDYGYNEILIKTEKLEQNFADANKRIKLVEQLLSLLNKQKYEPLWRHIYNRIMESQAEYPLKADTCYDSERLSKTRKKIQALMKSYGYSGTYPYFVKKGEMKKIHIAKSYNQTFFVGREKNVEYHIYCIENLCEDILTMRFVCGTAILRKNENVEDVFSCTFDAKGRRLSDIVFYEYEYTDSDGFLVSDNLEQKVQIAVKKAELQKLTKEEREACGLDTSVTSLLILGALALFMGLFFGVFMTLGMMLVCAIITLIVAGPQEVIPMIMEMPWLLLFVIAFVGFGGTMGVIEFIATRK